MKTMNKAVCKRIAVLLLLVLLTAQMSACSGKKSEKIDLSGTPLNISASSEFFDTAGEHVLSYTLTTAVLKKDGDVIFAHSFTNHSDYRITRITCEFYYYTDAGEVMAHKRLDRLLNAEPVEPGSTYTYYSKNNFDGAVPNSMAAHITCADTELETPVLPEPDLTGGFFAFFTDGRYDGLTFSFRTAPPVALRYKRDNESEITVSDADSIKAVYEAMENIRIVGKSPYSVTDSGAVYTFVMSDGSEYTVSFESESIIRYGNTEYEISGGKALFNIALKEDEYSRTDGNGYEDGKVE